MTTLQTMNYCSHCGNPVSVTIPEGDNRPRHVCNSCGEIHYQNPKIVAGCIPVWEDQFLICKRAIEPRKHFWTVPAGFLENGETIEEGAARETLEEACAKITDIQLYQIYNLTRINQIYILFRAHLCSADGFDIGQESLEVKLVRSNDIPWDDLAFKVVRQTLQRYVHERESGKFNFRTDTIA